MQMLAINVFRDTPMMYFVTEKHRPVGIDSKVHVRFSYVHSCTDYYTRIKPLTTLVTLLVRSPPG
jgi:hypothetical protein